MKLINKVRLFPKIGAILNLAVCLPFLIIIPPAIAQDSESLTLAPLNPEFLEHLYRVQTSRVQAETSDGFALGSMPSPVDLSHLTGGPLYAEQELLAAPSSYDLRSLEKLTPVKDQGNCGSCWSFATYASVESNLLPTETWDFSENNLKNTHGFDYGHCDGGNAIMSTAYLSRWSGPVKETDDPYDPYSNMSPSGLTARKHLQEALIIPNRASSSDNENVKQAVMTYGALYTTMYFNSAYYNSTYKAYYYNGPNNSNHAVAIVGWNDNFDRNKFSIIPPGNGAFIIKNSWGTGFGENGYFYISYYDTRIGSSNYLFNWAEPTTNYAQIYQYDPLGWTSGVGYGTDTAWFSNIFIASSSEQVAAVSFYTASLNSSYELSIYTNTTSGPTSGILGGSKMGTIPWPGYHTIVLDEPVPLTSGQRFSVVVKLTTPGYNYPVPMEMDFAGWSSGATASSGQSYLSSNGTSWTDITLYYGYENTNVCLKAFTIPIASLTIGSPNGGETWPTGSTKTITWASYDINPSGSIYIFYWYNDDWQEIAGSLSAGTTSHVWNIPDTPTASTGIRIGNWVNGAWEVHDQSDQSFILEKVSSPNRPSGPTSGSTNTSYTYTTTGSTSSAGHSVNYYFDWSDGTNSGWLPLGTSSTSKSWTVGGAHQIKVKARCANHTDVVSSWSEILTVNIPVSVTIASNPSGLQAIADSVYYTTPHTFDWIVGSTHTVEIPSPQDGVTGTRYVYANWSDGGAQSHSMTTPSANTTYAASFTTQYALTTSADPADGGSVTPSGSNWYNSGQNVPVLATATPGYTFVGWSGDLSGKTNPTSIIMSGQKNVTAIFERISIGSPSNGAVFDSGSLITNYQPLFIWTCAGVFSKYTILISTSPTDFTTKGIVINKASVSGVHNSWRPSSSKWKAIMRYSDNNGTIRSIYWKVVGTKADGTIVESGIRSFSIGPPQAATINAPLDGAILDSVELPTFDFDANGNRKFRLEISSLSDFSISTMVKRFNVTVSDPNLVPSFQKALSSSQWNGVKTLIGTETGYFRIKAWDGLNRPTVSEVRTFSIQ